MFLSIFSLFSSSFPVVMIFRRPKQNHKWRTKKELHLFKDTALCLCFYIPKEIPMDFAVSTSSPVGLTFFDFLPMTFSRES